MTAPSPAPQPADGEREVICEAEHENAEGTWTCTLPPGHDGRHEARDGCDVVDCVLVIHAHWPSATTPASAEPTEVDVQAAYELLRDDFPESCIYDDLHFRERAAVGRLARTLASQRAEIVARYEKVAAGLDGLYQVHHDNWRASGSTYAEGVSDGLGLASDRIREGAPK